MASDINFVKFIVDQIGNLGSIRYRKMFLANTQYIVKIKSLLWSAMTGYL